mgnify:CR=1 FL=1
MKSEAGLLQEEDTLSPLILWTDALVAKAKEAGLIMTNAGATYPYGKDPHDSNIRIAPSYPTLDEIKRAMEVFTLSVKLVSVEKLLAQVK